MKKRIVPILLLIIACITSGCSVGDTNVYFSTGNGVNYVFTMGDLKCPKSEADLYMGCFAGYYENMGGINLEDSNNANTKKADGLLSKSALALLTRVYSLNLYAMQRDISLSSEEESQINSYASTFYKGLTPEEKAKISIDEKDLKDAFAKYALAIKVYKSLMEGVDNEVTEDEARVMDAYVIHLTDSAKVSELEERLQAGDDFAALAQVYSEGNKKIVSFGREEYPKPFDDVAFKLEDEEVSNKIDTDEGIYYVQCINKYNTEKSEYNKGTIIGKRQKVLLDQINKEQSENNYSEINEEYFNQVIPSQLKIKTTGSTFVSIETELGY